MSNQITITLPDETYGRAQRLAQLTKRDVADIVADTLTLSLPQLYTPALAERTVDVLGNQEILALSKLQMNHAEDTRLSQLLDQQQAGLLDEHGRHELMGLMQIYQSLLLRQAEALAEAVRRGLREPLTNNPTP
jgi:hypothetical protein